MIHSEGELGTDYILQVLDGGSGVDFEVDRISLVWMRKADGNVPRIK